MISQALIVRDGHILMVKQYVFGGRIVWNFPGGGMEEDESPEEACIREVREETGYEIHLKSLLTVEHNKYTFIAEVIGGQLGFDRNNEANDDLLEAAWIPLQDLEKFDNVTPILKLFNEKESTLNV